MLLAALLPSQARRLVQMLHPSSLSRDGTNVHCVLPALQRQSNGQSLRPEARALEQVKVRVAIISPRSKTAWLEVDGFDYEIEKVKL